jgi:hypothetical protein
LPGFARIPKWFEHKNMGQTISFWFRNKLPSMALCFSTKSVATTSNNFDLDMKIPTLIFNGNKYDLRSLWFAFRIILTHHTYLIEINWEFEPLYNVNEMILENDWIHAEVTCENREMESLTEIGIHFYKQKNNMDDIQFTNPYEKIKLNDNDDDGHEVFYDVDDVLDDDNDGVFYDVYDVLDDEEETHSQ